MEHRLRRFDFASVGRTPVVRITARVSTLRAKAIADRPGHVGEELVWRVDNHKAVKRRRKTTRFVASDLQPVGHVLFLSYDE